MTKICYTLLAEGIVEGIVVPELLRKMASSQSISFQKSTISLKPSSKPSKSKVLKKVNEFARLSLLVEKEDLFIVGVDLDKADHDLSLSNAQEKEIRDLIPKQADKKKVIIFVPIQAFDHWLLYQNYKTTTAKRPSDHSLESKNPKDVKKELYGDSSPNQHQIKQTATTILSKLDAEELSKQSKSFKHFYDQLKKVLPVST